jgi:hypothetical protein
MKSLKFRTTKQPTVLKSSEVHILIKVYVFIPHIGSISLFPDSHLDIEISTCPNQVVIQ